MIQWPLNTQDDLNRVIAELRKRRGSFKDRKPKQPPKKPTRRSENTRSVTLDTLGQVLLVAEGGKGGVGNCGMDGSGARKQMSLVKNKLQLCCYLTSVQ